MPLFRRGRELSYTYTDNCWHDPPYEDCDCLTYDISFWWREGQRYIVVKGHGDRVRWREARFDRAAFESKCDRWVSWYKDYTHEPRFEG
jgi:hypothetical protein